MDSASHRQLLERIRAEYLEMPDMRLTAEQVGRLFGIDTRTCRVVLDALVDAKFLDLNQSGRYARLTDVSSGRRMAKASLNSDPHAERRRAS
jgi:hypothetical protein